MTEQQPVKKVKKKSNKVAIWSVIVIVIAFVVIIACANTGNDDDSRPTSATSAPRTAQSTKRKRPLQTIVISDLKTKVGEKVPAGRYSFVPPANGNGILQVTVPTEDQVETNHECYALSLSFGSNKSDGDISGPVTTTLFDGEEISIDKGLEGMKLVPVTKRSPQTMLTAGVWNVGKDIRPGNYTATLTDYESDGDLTVYSSDGASVFHRILGDDKANQEVHSVGVALSDGEIVEVGARGINFAK